ncbi:hypothetical protein [Bacteroides fragilis]|nr:hypothetical protein [Bacteroides fragilis]
MAISYVKIMHLRYSWTSQHYHQALIVPGSHEFYGGDDVANGDSWKYNDTAKSELLSKSSG